MSGLDRFPILARLACHPRQRQAFEDGALRERWAATYGPLGVIDDDDLRLARNQPWSHYYEWLAAITLFEATGWLSLIEKYQFPVHARKQSVLRELEAHDLLAFFAAQKPVHGSLQAPDLLLYAPDRSAYRLCEVKGPTDTYRPEQIAYFEALRESVGCEIGTVRFHAM